ncbi:MAG: C45 family autoproteolytic acyltransferase/hydrolase [Verrucomicrobiota bacterium]
MVPTWVHAEDFQPDPATVQRFGTGYRYPQSGWTVVHIEGKPYERGMQHGRLLAPEIAGFILRLASNTKPEAAEEIWKLKRSFVNAMFTRRFNEEQLQEMQGIADGATAAGAQFAGHPVDLLDIVAINTTTEMESIDVAMSATPTGMEGLRPTEIMPPQVRPAHRQGEHCGAFVANGAATRDGKIVLGHITTDDLLPACYFNIWLDLQPTSGHHFAMQTVPGGIFSSMDYSISDSGIVMAETNISQTTFDPSGTPLASRVRQATQYAESLDQTIEILTRNENGLGSAEWILADLKRNETALLVMGTRQNKVFRSSRNEWPAGAEGFYWSCNNAKDRAVRLESVASMKVSATAVAADLPTKRDSIWLQFYEQNKGHIDAAAARLALTTPVLTTSHAVDGVFTTTDLGLQLKSWACFGPPAGIVRLPTFFDRRKFPAVRALVANPWTILQATPPATPATPVEQAADLHDPVDGGFPEQAEASGEPPHPPLWHGTLVPAGDPDIWLANGFAIYRGLATRDKYLTAKNAESGVDPRGMDDLATELFYYRSVYEQGARNDTELPLAKIQASYRNEAWNQVSLGKGVLLLHSLKGLVGAARFEELMEDFGRENGGKEVSSRQFQEFIEKGTGRSWSAFFDAWLNHTGLPLLELGEIEPHREGDHWRTKVAVRRNATGAPLTVTVTVETDNGENSAVVRLEQAEGIAEITTHEPPRRVILDKYRTAACSNGVPFTSLTFDNDLEHTLILYGTLDEADANREAALMLQQALCRREHNISAPVKADTEATEDELRNHHLVLLGHPASNALAARFRTAIPVVFGPHSFTIRGVPYANPDTSVLVAAANPLNRRFSLVLCAGLGTRATVDLVRKLEEDNLSYAPLVLLPAGQKEHNMVLCPAEFIRAIPPAKPGD